MANFFTVASVCLLVSLSVQASDPFDKGKYNVKSFTVTPFINNCPLRSTVYYPDSKGQFPPILFIGGLAGVAGAELYSDYIARVAAHGYIVTGLDRLSVGNETKKSFLKESNHFPQGDGKDLGLSTYATPFLRQVVWLKGYLIGYNNSFTVDWSQTSMMCHSEGCDTVLNMFLEQPSIAKAAVYLDPVSVTSRLINQFTVRVPAIATMSEMSELFPTCCIKGLGFRRFYDLMPCLKVKMEIKGFGHCAIINKVGWDACHISGFCQTNNGTNLDGYKNFVKGTAISFLRWTLNGDLNLRKYVIETKYVKLPLLEFAYSLDQC